ncbi:DEAD/DEAH box helicase [Paenibacillus aquistagni]|uniref:SWIM zinc finger n=1 Tax=Paenibacillus aquistagni TaxID=1852522 RepID=A0A1X7L5T3_9BACL|nr:DEAD/DEAH box helicase [Paenibacillus aquistagni]SMG49130.1 SWIM zinc finger [Paenibacillus aquistagni]
MSHALSLSDIKSLCGTSAYRRGEAYFREHRVKKEEYRTSDGVYQAIVRGSDPYHVHIAFDGDKVAHAACTCPAYGTYRSYCKHIAATLLDIRAMERGEHAGGAAEEEPATPIRPAQRAASQLISLFEGIEEDHLELREEEAEARIPLTVEYACRFAQPIGQPPQFGIEIKLGTVRSYMVSNIKEFLEHVISQQEYTISKSFTWEPHVYRFRPQDETVLRALAELSSREQAYREVVQKSFNRYGSGGYFGQGRELYIPPFALQTILPLLSDCLVRFEANGVAYPGVALSENPLPVQFQLYEKGQAGYELSCDGLHELELVEHYQIAMAGRELYPLRAKQLRLLKDMRQLLQDTAPLYITHEELPLFIARVVPELSRMCQVHIENAIEERLVRVPLEAKLYLDMAERRMHARLTYQYGDVILEPMQQDIEELEKVDTEIRLRDVIKEDRIMALMEQSAFKYNGATLYMDQEEDIAHFLFYLLPRLERWVSIYTTPALQGTMRMRQAAPQLSVDLDPQMNWLDVDFEIEGMSETEIKELLTHLVEKKKYYRLQDGAYLWLDDTRFRRISQLMSGMGMKQKDVQGSHFSMSLTRGLYLLDEEETYGSASVKLGQDLRELLRNLRAPGSLSFEVPPSLESVLRDYQRTGYQWMRTLAHYRFGGILADDMGLGKTLQSIAFLQSQAGEARSTSQPALIVAPASLLYNWQYELSRFAPELRTAVIAGSKEERQLLLRAMGDDQAEHEVDVYITSYPLLRRDIEAYDGQGFRTLILDEAQAIKNHASQTAHAVKQLRAVQRFALTGTPIENRLEELWSIFDAVFPDLFMNRRQFLELSREHVALKVRPFILRRMKADVLTELPEKIETLQKTELYPDQKRLYLAYLSQLKEDTRTQLHEEGFQKSRMKILAGLTRLRQLCCHPALFLENYDGGSGKLEHLLELIQECMASGKRMLVFSQFTEMLKVIRLELESQLGLSCFYLDGSTPARERLELCNRFNEGQESVFLISLKAGGTGLNLTGADTVILYDLWWNPAVEQQAADRAHRMGQKKVVQVIRLVTQGTIEEKMIELQDRKRDLIDEVIQANDSESQSILTEQDIRDLLMLEER